ncbi:transcriptional regulator, TetR family [Pustulibacterium marinum]|uniref:Transcriptional regulator, TetR family n=2 Tax=Pustulibacterium marinum TaxID=1224947 RepID=A0A1I7I673_9FLAO|nr:transcriptional regulator, TetR family [Pustulibacterium marinum]
MDDIAQESGISKKTIYQHFKNKTELIQSCVDDSMKTVAINISEVKTKGLNAVQEQLEIRNVILAQLKNEKTSPHLQLQRYYPGIYKITRTKHFELVYASVSQNLQKGIGEGLYRKELDLDIITRMHFICAIELKNQDIFPSENYSVRDLMNIYIENYLRSIVTPKGLEILEQHLHNQ